MFYEWTGRVDEQAKSKRLHQVVQNKEIAQLPEADTLSFGFIGFECDEGVRRNQGRLGASQAPNAIRKQMSSIPYHMKKENVYDIGNIACKDGDLEGAQERLGNHVATLLDKNYTPIIFGGGHETFYGHYLGARKKLGPDAKIGMINLDAHFDLRNDPVPSSGTMFRQILEADDQANYLCIGIQDLGNTDDLFMTADQYGVQYIKEDEIYPIDHTYDRIRSFANEHDAVIYTICTDVINQAAAPGVSAPAPFGLQTKTVREISNYVVGLHNFISMDVSEVNPTYDIDDRTSKLIGYLLAEVIWHKQLNKND